MRLLDIHSHILADMDDGAKNIDESLTLLRMMKDQGITDVIATPHFDATCQNMEDFQQKINEAKLKLTPFYSREELPDLYFGSEVYYFDGIGRSPGIRTLTLGNSKYMLLELQNRRISKEVLRDIIDLRENLGVFPILAHIERYSEEFGFKKLLKLISSGAAYAQVNATSLLTPSYRQHTYNLIKRGFVSFIATDSHSPDLRPPKMDVALAEVENKLGKEYRQLFVKNSNMLLQDVKGAK